MNKTILIIDDDGALRDVLASGLRGAGFDVLTADSAESGESILKRFAPDAIVLDRMMGGADGVTALAKWRANGDTTPVILLTAMTGPENAVDGLAHGADDYLAKPFQLKELILRLHNIMQRRATGEAPLPDGLACLDGEFFIGARDHAKLLALSNAEKDLLGALTRPVGTISGASPMVAKRLREKLKSGANLDIVTVRGKGYKLVSCKS